MQTSFDLTNEIAVVIGATGALDGAIARALAASGARVAVVGRNAEASARGVALLALEAIGEISDVSDVKFECGEVLLPDTNRSAIYARALEHQNVLLAKLYQ